MIREFIRYSFARSTMAVSNEVVEEVVEGRPRSSPSTVAPEQRTRAGMVVAINWVMLGVLVLGFCDIIASSWIHPATAVPDIIQNVVSGAAGYFLSSIAAFVRSGRP